MPRLTGLKAINRGTAIIGGNTLFEIDFLMRQISFVGGQGDTATEGNDKKRSFTTQRSFTFSEH